MEKRAVARAEDSCSSNEIALQHVPRRFDE